MELHEKSLEDLFHFSKLIPKLNIYLKTEAVAPCHCQSAALMGRVHAPGKAYPRGVPTAGTDI